VHACVCVCVCVLQIRVCLSEYKREPEKEREEWEWHTIRGRNENDTLHTSTLSPTPSPPPSLPPTPSLPTTNSHKQNSEHLLGSRNLLPNCKDLARDFVNCFEDTHRDYDGHHYLLIFREIYLLNLFKTRILKRPEMQQSLWNFQKKHGFNLERWLLQHTWKLTEIANVENHIGKNLSHRPDPHMSVWKSKTVMNLSEIHTHTYTRTFPKNKTSLFKHCFLVWYRMTAFLSIPLPSTSSWPT